MAKETKICRNCTGSFTIEPDDAAFYARIDVPLPTLCPECRFKRRAVWRNETTLYNRACGLCNAPVISMYNPKSPYVVYCNTCWISDKWDPGSYAMDYDPERPFLEQFNALLLKVPKWATYSSPASGPNINSEYTNFAGGNKDCYLIFNSGPKNENCAYSRGLTNTQNVFDTYYGDGLERVYEGVNVQKSAGVAWSTDVSDCLDSAFLLNCSGCKDCFGCVNLRHATNCFFNEQLTAEEYRRRVDEITGSRTKIAEARRRFEELARNLPRRENSNLKSVNCIGNYLIESKDCRHSFEVAGGENLCYSFSTKWGKDNYDIAGHGRKSELLYECVGVGWSSRIWFSSSVESSHDVEYSHTVRSSQYCFGCDAVRNGEHMILNKRYTEEEYRRLREDIIGKMKAEGTYGEFFPIGMAPFGYNETVAEDNFPLSREEAVAHGYRWEENVQMTTGKETLRPEEVPDHIDDVQDSILGGVLRCAGCGRNYKVIPVELAFYRQMKLPVPAECFYCRHRARIRRRGPMEIFDSACAKCDKSIKTTYAPDRPEIVYCESCYQSEVA